MVSIRLATTKDIKKLADIYSRAFHGMHPHEQWTSETAERFLTSFLQRQPDLAFLAMDGKQIVGGFFAAIRPWWDGNHLVDGELFVDSAAQRHGVGSALMKHLLNQAVQTHQAIVMEAITFKDEGFPLNWYKKAGCQTVDDMVIISGKISDLHF